MSSIAAISAHWAAAASAAFPKGAAGSSEARSQGELRTIWRWVMVRAWAEERAFATPRRVLQCPVCAQQRCAHARRFVHDVANASGAARVSGPVHAWHEHAAKGTRWLHGLGWLTGVLPTLCVVPTHTRLLQSPHAVMVSQKAKVVRQFINTKVTGEARNTLCRHLRLIQPAKGALLYRQGDGT